MKVENISRFKKDRFMKSLSEDDFRDRAVRPLMLRSGYKDGRDLCGPNEHGKDAIFITIDPFGLSTVIAVQSKKGNLNLAGTTQRNLIDAITQVILISIKNRINNPWPFGNAGDTSAVIFHHTQCIDEVIFEGADAIKYAIMEMLFPKLVPKMFDRVQFG